MDILVLGSKGHKLGCHASEKLTEEFENFDNECVFLDPVDLNIKWTKERWFYYKYKKNSFPLSRVLGFVDMTPELIYIDETNFYWENDLDIPLMYYHREQYRPLTVDKFDIIFMYHKELLRYFRVWVAPNRMYNCNIRGAMPYAVDPTIYYPKDKTIRGIIGIGYRAGFNAWLKMGEIYHHPALQIMMAQISQYKSLGLPYWDTPINDFQYRETIMRSEAHWFPLSCYQFISRRLFECSACKTVPIFLLEGKRHVDALKNIGYINGKHYIGLTNIKHIKKAHILYNFEEIAENGYELIMKRHTYKKRAEEILKIYDFFLH